MRYSMLVYITQMARTLLEAAQYLRTAPEDSLRTELLENGRQMLAQIRQVLNRHSEDLLSAAPLEKLSEIERLWERGAAEAALGQLVQDLPGQVAYQVRAVFFAELGEKWDAMESVYEFMRDDPRFDPIVVRTPIGRVVTQNGVRKQETIYKDFLTPMGIPSLGYDQYSLEEDCPELAFISQPYESCTLRQFWPENIAKYTRLVYLSYHLPGIVLDDYPQTLCQMPVYDYAWKVIGSNQNHYKYYCKHSHHGGGNMVVTGLPKTDPLVDLRNRKPPLPAGWEKIQGRKTFLWNTWFSIGTSSLRFFEETYAWFQAHNNCALIWRPHPMTDTVVKLYTPDRYPYLQQCIQKVKSAPNMVLDEEISFRPAFAYSDAQVSDHSSMMHQYLFMDKPLLWFSSLSASMTGEYFIDCRWMERAEDWNGILAFLERIKMGQDKNTRLRSEVWQRDLPLVDGHCGKRVCEILWGRLHSEDGLLLNDTTEKGV